MKRKSKTFLRDIIFLIEKPEGGLPCNVFAFFPNDRYNDVDSDMYRSYAHIGQHSACHIDYAKECKEAEYSEFEPLLKELISIGYNDLKVLNTQVLEAHREPTKGEIKFGEGATHYRDFSIGEVLNKKGDIKKWFVDPLDGLRYYTN